MLALSVNSRAIDGEFGLASRSKWSDVCGEPRCQNKVYAFEILPTNTLSRQARPDLRGKTEALRAFEPLRAEHSANSCSTLLAIPQTALLSVARAITTSRLHRSRETHVMSDHVVVWDLETVPDIAGYAAANSLTGKLDKEIREALGNKFQSASTTRRQGEIGLARFFATTTTLNATDKEIYFPYQLTIRSNNRCSRIVFVIRSMYSLLFNLGTSHARQTSQNSCSARCS